MAWICEYPSRIAVSARRMPGVCNRGGHLLSSNVDFAVFSVRRFCVENLSHKAAPYASNNEALRSRAVKSPVSTVARSRDWFRSRILLFAVKIFWNLRPSGRYFSNWRPIGIGLGHGCAALPRREESFDCLRDLARCLIAPLRRSERQSIFFVGKVAEFQKDGRNVGRF
jgi:hypothetical protein